MLSKRGKKRVRSRANTTETIERNLDQEEKEWEESKKNERRVFGYSVISRELTPHVLILLRSVTLPYRFLVFHRTTDRSLTCSVNLLNRVPHGIVNQLIRSMLLHKPNKPKEMRAAFQRTWINQFRCFCLFICLFLFFLFVFFLSFFVFVANFVLIFVLVRICVCVKHQGTYSWDVQRIRRISPSRLSRRFLCYTHPSPDEFSIDSFRLILFLFFFFSWKGKGRDPFSFFFFLFFKRRNGNRVVWRHHWRRIFKEKEEEEEENEEEREEEEK